LQISAKWFGSSILTSQHGGVASQKAILSSVDANPTVWDTNIVVASSA